MEVMVAVPVVITCPAVLACCHVTGVSRVVIYKKSKPVGGRRFS